MKAFGQTMFRHGFERTDVRNHRITGEDGTARRAWYNVAYKTEEGSSGWASRGPVVTIMATGPSPNSVGTNEAEPGKDGGPWKRETRAADAQK